MELRPLGFGEIFDRAVTLYVRNFWPLFAIMLVIVAPAAVLEYTVTSLQSAQLAALLQILTHPSATPPALPPGFDSPGQLAETLAVALVTYAMWPFVFGAIAVGVARLYGGSGVEFAACYRSVLPRWKPLLLLLLATVGVLLAWYVAFLLIFLGMVLVAAALSAIAVPLGIVAFVAAFAVLLASLLLLAPVILALGFAVNAIVIERAGAGAALGLGFRRIFNAKEFLRSIVFALAALAVGVGASLVVGAVAFAILLAHAVVLEVVIASLLRAAIQPFTIVLIAVYYFDVRVRREAYDLQAEFERLDGRLA